MPLSRYFRFRLRTLLAAVFVVSLPLAWMGYSLNWIRERRVFFVRQSVWHWMPNRSPENQPRAPRGLWLLGERGVKILPVVPEYTDEAKRLFPEAEVMELKR